MWRMADSRRTLLVMLFSVSVEDRAKSLKKSISISMSCLQMVRDIFSSDKWKNLVAIFLELLLIMCYILTF
jgi:uncharacterized alpha-E superfamily protein